MISSVIKRNGSKEAFQPEKLNKWGVWASDQLDPAVVSWSEVALRATATLQGEVTSQQIQEALIKYCLDKDTYEHNMMAGRLYASLLPKVIYGSAKHPHIRDLLKTMSKKGLIVYPDYTDEEMNIINCMLNHPRDLTYAHYSINQLVNKLSVKDSATNTLYETPQFVYMRVALHAFKDYHEADRLQKLQELYECMSQRKINVPTPYFTNSLTSNSNVASCALVTCGDTAESIGTMQALTYMLTVSSAGLGIHAKTRSINDPVRGGMIRHQGKVPYYRGIVNMIKSSLQNQRSGASTIYYPYFDPEILTLLALKNPMSTEANRVRNSDYAFQLNKYFMKKVAKNEDVYLFSYLDNPELYELFYSPDVELFEEKMEEFAKTNPDKVTPIKAMEIMKVFIQNTMETGRVYMHFVDEANRHTPYKDKIYSSNLCNEIQLPTSPFPTYESLYDATPENEGRVAFCNLAGILVDNIVDDEDYEKATYNALLLIQSGIDNADLAFPALNAQIRASKSAGVGILGLAHLLASKGLSYSSREGKVFMHELAETHAYYLYKAALRLTKERGREYVEWDNTKFAEGWLPIDTYNKNVDEIVPNDLKRDWEGLRKEIVETGGLNFSTVACIPPSETSSISSETTTAIYPIRDFTLVKTNGNNAVRWVAPDATKLRDKYEIVWKVPNKDIIEMYAIFQKFIDQGISGDLFIDRSQGNNVSMKELIQECMWLCKYGVKGRYYYNSKVEREIDLGSKDTYGSKEPEEDCGCSSGACTL